MKTPFSLAELRLTALLALWAGGLAMSPPAAAQEAVKLEPRRELVP